MKAHELTRLECVHPVALNTPEADVIDAYTSDLLSDVMGQAPEESVLITIQAHKNTIAVASLAGVNSVLFCNNRAIPDDVLAAAAEQGINLFRTTWNQYESSWRVHELLTQA